jgi:hypothetical protein
MTHAQYHLHIRLDVRSTPPYLLQTLFPEWAPRKETELKVVPDNSISHTPFPTRRQYNKDVYSKNSILEGTTNKEKIKQEDTVSKS